MVEVGDRFLEWLAGNLGTGVGSGYSLQSERSDVNRCRLESEVPDEGWRYLPHAIPHGEDVVVG